MVISIFGDGKSSHQIFKWCYTFFIVIFHYFSAFDYNFSKVKEILKKKTFFEILKKEKVFLGVLSKISLSGLKIQRLVFFYFSDFYFILFFENDGICYWIIKPFHIFFPKKLFFGEVEFWKRFWGGRFLDFLIFIFLYFILFFNDGKDCDWLFEPFLPYFYVCLFIYCSTVIFIFSYDKDCDWLFWTIFALFLCAFINLRLNGYFHFL